MARCQFYWVSGIETELSVLFCYFWRKLNSTPNDDLEKVLYVQAVIQD